MSAAPTEGGGTTAEQLRDRVRFLGRHEPFRTLSPDELQRIAAAIQIRIVPAGESVLVESGVPGTELYVVREGAVELLHKEALVALATSGEVIGYPSLLTGLPPEFTTRASVDAILYCIPRDVAFDLLRHPEGLMWLAGNQRERLIQAARTMRSLPDVRNRPVTSVVRSSPLAKRSARFAVARSCSAVIRPRRTDAPTDTNPLCFCRCTPR